jgi:hypothetical protein
MAEGVEVSWCAEIVERRREKAKRGAARMTIEGVGVLETLRWGWLVLVRRLDGAVVPVSVLIPVGVPSR